MSEIEKKQQLELYLRQEQVEEFKELLERNPDLVNFKENEVDATLLSNVFTHYTASSSMTLTLNPLIEFVLETGADPLTCGYAGQTLLHMAISKEYTPMVEHLLSRADILNIVKKECFQGNTAICYGLRLGLNAIIFKILIALKDKGILRDYLGSGDESLHLIMNAVITKNLEFLKFFANIAPETFAKIIRLPDKHGHTPLFFAYDTFDQGLIDFIKRRSIFSSRTSDAFVRRCLEIEEAAQVFGLEKGDINVYRDDLQREEKIRIGAGHHLVGLDILARYLQITISDPSLAIDPFAIECFSKVCLAINKYISLLQSGLSKEEFVDQLLEDSKQKPIIIPIETMGHVSAIAIYKNYLVYCNRAGVYDSVEAKNTNPQHGLTKVYRIVLNDSLSELLLNFFGSKEGGIVLSGMEADDILTKILQGSELLAILPSKVQRHINCAFISSKSAIEGILYLLKLEDKDSDKLARELAEINYKKFTNLIRNRVIDARIAAKDVGILKAILTKYETQEAPERKPGDVERSFSTLKKTQDQERKVRVQSALQQLTTTY